MTSEVLRGSCTFYITDRGVLINFHTESHLTYYAVARLQRKLLLALVYTGKLTGIATVEKLYHYSSAGHV